MHGLRRHPLGQKRLPLRTLKSQDLRTRNPPPNRPLHRQAQRRRRPRRALRAQTRSLQSYTPLRFQDGGSMAIRFPCPEASVYPEKVRREVAVIQFLGYATSLRVPYVLHYGDAEESPEGLGPFIIMEYIGNEGDLVGALNVPGRSGLDRPILDPDVSRERLEVCVRPDADIVLQLTRHSFAEIGCIGKANEEDEFDDSWVVKHRPLTFNMNELVQLGGVSPAQLPRGTFKTASSYYRALAETHMTHLFSQQNDAVNSAE